MSGGLYAGDFPSAIFVGNPNCGKTTLFNAITGSDRKVANWPGVTVERVEGFFSFKDRTFRLLDTPGTYSLDSHTIEEQVTKRCLEEETADVIVNVVDATALERNLYLTLQLLNRGYPVVLALNMMDLALSRGIEIDTDILSQGLGNIPVVQVSAAKRLGMEALQKNIYLTAGKNFCRTESQMQRENQIKKTVSENFHIPKEQEQFYSYIDLLLGKCRRQGKRMNESGKSVSGEPDRGFNMTDYADRLFTHRILGIPLFFMILGLVFFLTFAIGGFLKGYLETGMDIIREGVSFIFSRAGVSDWLSSLILEGIVTGVGSVLSFLPNLVILFLALGVLEDSGYMARVAYVMNETMAMAGLSGKAFLPMILGFGCTVPAVFATRVLETRRDRLRAILAIPFMSCSARLPVYVLLSELFFPETAAMTAWSLYLIGVLTGILAACADNWRYRIRGQYNMKFDGYESTLLMELPDYRKPSLQTLRYYVKDKVGEYLTKAGTTIFLASFGLWFLLYAGPGGIALNVTESFAARMGMMLAPLLAPAGLGQWQTAVALISGLSAKEVVVSSISVLYGVESFHSPEGMNTLRTIMEAAGFTNASAYALMLFCLLYTPCIAALSAIRRETGSLKWTAGMMTAQLLLAWGAAVLVFQVGSRL